MKIRIGIVFIKIMSLFSLKTARNFGKLLGYCAYLANTRLYKTSLTNLRLCFPQLSAAENKDMAIKSLMHTGMTLAECGPVWLWPIEKIMLEIEGVEGEELLQKARDQGLGIILLGPHHGNWELMGLYLSSIGKCSMLYLDPKHQDLDDLISKARSRGSAKLYPADKRALQPSCRRLKKVKWLGYYLTRFL